MKIIATVRRDNEKYEDQTHFLNRIELLFNKGVTQYRVNIGKWEKQEFQQVIFDISTLRDIYRKDICIMLDLPYPGKKARISVPGRKRIPLIASEHLNIVSDLEKFEELSGITVGVNVNEIGTKLCESDEIIYGDGDARLKVVKVISKDHVEVEALNNMTISHAKSIFFRGSVIINDHLEENIFQLVNEISPDVVALSFLESIHYLEKARKMVDNAHCRFMPKIETMKAVERIDQIAQYSDLIMLGRGDLGFDIPLWKFADMQKNLINKCNQWHKPIYVATDVLDSLSHRPYPSRADLIDLACIQESMAEGVVLTYSLVRSSQLLQAIDIIQKIGDQSR